MAASTYETFIKFNTDAVGLERTFRLFQSIAHILTSYATPFAWFLTLLGFLSSSNSSSNDDGIPGSSVVVDGVLTRTVLLALRQRLALIRRCMRLFRCLDAFRGAQQKLYSSASSSSPMVETYLDVFSATFNGMYLLLEASTVVEALDIPGFRVWDPKTAKSLNVEAQRFWLFALACGVLVGGLRAWKVFWGEGAVVVVVEEKTKEKKDEKENDNDKKAIEMKKEKLKKEERRARLIKLGRGVLANALDMTQPGSVTGWMPASSGTVGSAMFVTTILTSMDVWERCAKEIASGK